MVEFKTVVQSKSLVNSDFYFKKKNWPLSWAIFQDVAHKNRFSKKVPNFAKNDVSKVFCDIFSSIQKSMNHVNFKGRCTLVCIHKIFSTNSVCDLYLSSYCPCIDCWTLYSMYTKQLVTFSAWEFPIWDFWRISKNVIDGSLSDSVSYVIGMA